MRYFKRFTDFCSGFACFTAIIYLFRQYMTYKLGDEEAEIGLVDKLKMFFSRQTELEHYLMLMLAVMLAVSVLASVILNKLPQLTFVFSLPPLLLSLDMIKSEYIREYPMMYPLLGSLAVIGGIYECVRMDKRDGKHRSAYAGSVVSAFASAFCFYIYKKWQTFSALTHEETENALEMRRFDYEIYNHADAMDMKLFLTFAIVFGCLAVIGVILTDIYFIDAILALPPMVALIYTWGAEKISVHPEMLVALSVAIFTTRIIPTVSCKATYRKSAKKLNS